MKTLRQIHLYLGCVFAPLIIYFALSGAWQVFGWHDLPKDQAPSWSQKVLHEISKPHTHSTLPGSPPKAEESDAFSAFALVMGLGLVSTTLMGVVLAHRFGKSKKLVWASMICGLVLPIILLFIKG